MPQQTALVNLELASVPSGYTTISFLSDFGVSDEFVGVVHSVFRSIAPEVEVIDITHGVPPHDVRAGSLALARSVEYFKIPRNVLTVCLGKSTYARCGIIVNVTPFEPEWEGHVTLEISNTTPLPAKIYSNEGLCQVLFFESDEECETSYKDKKGKYQKQTGITLPKIK